MIIYLVNSDCGPVSAYTCHEAAVEKAVLDVVADHYNGYGWCSKQELDTIKSDIKNGSRDYTHWIEEIELNTIGTVSSEPFKVQHI